MGDYIRNQNPGLRDLDQILEALDSFDDDPGQFLQTCAEVGIKPVVDPFWKDLPYVHIYRSITPNILHQLYQGILKHLIGWVIKVFGPLEIDALCRRLPPNHNIRHFVKGISSLSRVTGQEHNQMSRILLGLVIDCPLPGGLSNPCLIRAVRALLDFIYLAQYPVHTDKTLALLEDALNHFHDNKDIFVDLGIRDAFNIPKLHFARHYVDNIKLYWTLDNYNTEYTETAYRPRKGCLRCNKSQGRVHTNGNLVRTEGKKFFGTANTLTGDSTGLLHLHKLSGHHLGLSLIETLSSQSIQQPVWFILTFWFRNMVPPISTQPSNVLSR